MKGLQTNTLYYGDNLPILRDYIPDESVDLVYLDPPFNSNATYNVLFKESAGAASEAQLGAFEDTWHWGPAAIAAYEQIALHGTDDTARLLKAMVDALGHNDMTAYLSMMAVRLVELHRVLKPAGSIYLHCDPTASHYLKVLMDSIFGAKLFLNEIVWQRTGAHSDARRWGRISDTLLYFVRDGNWTWRTQYEPYTEEYIDERYKYVDEKTGRRHWRNTMTAAGPGPARKFRGVLREPPAGTHWRFSQTEIDRLQREDRIYYSPKGMPYIKSFLDERKGRAVQSIWTDIAMSKSGAERLGYATQKPLALLERIINASSNAGDVVLDPFCGCGTAVHAAHKLGRRWIGIDITHLAIGLIRRRMQDAFPTIKIKVVGEPVDLPGAQELAAKDPYQFQWWALDRLAAQSITDRKRGMDRGIDGVIPFIEQGTERKRVIVSVKAGAIGPQHVRDLKGVLDREKEPIGVLLTMRSPTREMKNEAAAAGTYRSERWKKSYARIQLMSAEDLLNGMPVQMPPAIDPFAKAARERVSEGEQKRLKL